MKELLTNIAASLVTLVLFGSLLSFNKSTNDNNDGVPVGTVIYSIIPPTQFLQANKGWAKIDGSSIDQNSELSHIIQETGILGHLNGKLPNGSGMFIRNMNYNSDGTDPDKSRNVGLSQSDALKSHSHPHSHSISIYGTTSSTSHSHTYSDKSTDIGWNDHTWQSSSMVEGGGPITLSSIDQSRTKNVYSNNSSSYESHSHSFSWSGTTGSSSTSTGDIETRPVNIALYAYIKIN